MKSTKAQTEMSRPNLFVEIGTSTYHDLGRTAGDQWQKARQSPSLVTKNHSAEVQQSQPPSSLTEASSRSVRCLRRVGFTGAQGSAERHHAGLLGFSHADLAGLDTPLEPQPGNLRQCSIVQRSCHRRV